MKKEKIKIVPKVWGEELWVVNSNLYCGKLLTINEGSQGSYHYHNKKEETFYCIYGEVKLTVNGKDYKMTQFTSPRTIKPKGAHSITGIVTSVIMEVSTPHDDRDVVRLSESKK